MRQWIHRYDSQGRVVAEEYRTGRAGNTEVVYTVDKTYSKGLLVRSECRNYGSLDWIEYVEYR